MDYLEIYSDECLEEADIEISADGDDCSGVIYFCVMTLQLADTSKHRRSAARGQAKIIPKSPDESILITEFNRRKKLIKDTCEKFGAFTTREKLLAKMKLKPGPELFSGVETDDQLWSILKRTSHHQFFVQKEHGLMWCKVPKAASTSWLHAYNRGLYKRSQVSWRLLLRHVRCRYCCQV